MSLGDERLGVAHARLGTVLERAVVVGDHEGVRTQARVGCLALVPEPAEQAFFAQQARDEVEVALLVLDAQGALRVAAPGTASALPKLGDRLGIRCGSTSFARPFTSSPGP